jgi:prostaglandin-endoperoxide synthase 2
MQSRLGFRVRKHIISNYPWVWQLVRATPLLRDIVNRGFIDSLASSARPRPHPLSLGADYVSWRDLFDRTYTGRHLPPAEQSWVDGLPDVKRLEALFARDGAMLPCPKSSALFGFFAQWFTDSFLRTDPDDNRKNTSNHEIDLCQIYGLKAADTRIIRGQGLRGELEFQIINGEEYPPNLFQADGLRVKKPYEGLSYIKADSGDFLHDVLPQGFNTPERKATFFVTGLERGNSTILYSALNTIFLREHNRLCRALDRAHHDWSDDRLFETARNINIAQIIKIIVHDYINHLSPAQFQMFMEVGFAETKPWYRTNRICAEFNLLYRWHQLVPTRLKLGGKVYPDTEFRFKNDLLLAQGIEALMAAASEQAAGRIALKNTAPFLVAADVAALVKARAWRIQPYAAYLKAFNIPALRTFEQLTGEKELARELKALYQTVDRVEYPIGLLAEERTERSMLGDLMTAMVGVDAFSQALTNPLLSKAVFGPGAFSDVGVATINNTATLADVVKRTTQIGDRRVSFALRKIPGSYGWPLVGWIWDTLDIFLFSGVDKFFRRRQEKLGSTVFKINLFQPTIAMLDHRAISSLFASKDLVQEKPSNRFQFQIPPLPLVGNVAPSMFGDGDAHDVPKRVYQRLLRERADTLAPVFQQTLNEFTDRWLKKQRFNFRDELEDFVVTFVFRWMLGANPVPGDVRYLYNNIFSHWAMPLTRYLPFSGFRRSLGIYGRLLEFVKTSPKFAEIAQLAAAEGLRDQEVLAKHLCFVLGMNSFLGNQNFLKSIIGELNLHAALCDKLRGEIEEAVPGEGPVDVRRLMQGLPSLDKTLREILRLHPPVFFVYGRATRDRVIESASGEFAIAEGDLVLGVIPMAQRDPGVFDHPEQFDADRFRHPRASEHLIWPRGPHDDPVAPEGRTCPGKDVALVIAKLFCAELLPNYDWRLKNIPAWSWRFTLNVAAPKGKLAVTSFARRQRQPNIQADAEIRPLPPRQAAG